MGFLAYNAIRQGINMLRASSNEEVKNEGPKSSRLTSLIIPITLYSGETILIVLPAVAFGGALIAGSTGLLPHPLNSISALHLGLGAGLGIAAAGGALFLLNSAVGGFNILRAIRSSENVKVTKWQEVANKNEKKRVERSERETSETEAKESKEVREEKSARESEREEGSVEEEKSETQNVKDEKQLDASKIFEEQLDEVKEKIEKKNKEEAERLFNNICLQTKALPSDKIQERKDALEDALKNWASIEGLDEEMSDFISGTLMELIDNPKEEKIDTFPEFL